MSKQQRKQQKQKKRKSESKDKVLKIRAKKRAIAKEEREEFRKEKMIRKIKRDMEGLDLWADEVYEKLPENTLKQLQHNAKILRSLEEEYEKEIKDKKDRQEKMKTEGAATLGDMVQRLKSVNTADESEELKTASDMLTQLDPPFVNNEIIETENSD